MSRITPLIALVTCLTLAIAATSPAEIIHVPGDQPTIQLAIGRAADGDTVLIAPDTYHEAIDFLGKSIVVGSRYVTTGDPACVDSTIIDGGGALGPLVTFGSGEDSLAVLAGVTVQHGDALNGGGVLCEWSSPRITACVLKSNKADHEGGGLYGWHSDFIVEGCRFESNVSDAGSGGGLGCRYGAPRIVESAFFDNTAQNTGGGIFCEHSSPVIRDNVIEENEGTSTYAGGIMSRNCDAVIVGNVISHNHTYGRGGGLFY